MRADRICAGPIARPRLPPQTDRRRRPLGRRRLLLVEKATAGSGPALVRPILLALLTRDGVGDTRNGRTFSVQRDMPPSRPLRRHRPAPTDTLVDSLRPGLAGSLLALQAAGATRLVDSVVPKPLGPAYQQLPLVAPADLLASAGVPLSRPFALRSPSNTNTAAPRQALRPRPQHGPA